MCILYNIMWIHVLYNIRAYMHYMYVIFPITVVFRSSSIIIWQIIITDQTVKSQLDLKTRKVYTVIREKIRVIYVNIILLYL